MRQNVLKLKLSEILIDEFRSISEKWVLRITLESAQSLFDERFQFERLRLKDI